MTQVARLLQLAAMTMMLAGCGRHEEDQGSAQGQGRRYVFIDGGAGKLGVTLAFEKTRLFKDYPWHEYLIEADLDQVRQMPAREDRTIIGKAIATRDGRIKFFRAKPNHNIGQNSMMETALLANDLDPSAVEVEAFDFSQWIGQVFTRDDYLLVTLDIQGAEYPVLERMLCSGTIGLVDRLYVELHPHLVESGDERTANLVQSLPRVVPTVKWDSMEDIMAQGDWSDRL